MHAYFRLSPIAQSLINTGGGGEGWIDFFSDSIWDKCCSAILCNGDELVNLIKD